MQKHCKYSCVVNSFNHSVSQVEFLCQKYSGQLLTTCFQYFKYSGVVENCLAL